MTLVSLYEIDELIPAGFGKVGFRIVANGLAYRYVLAHGAIKWLDATKPLTSNNDLIAVVEANKARILKVAIANKDRCLDATPLMITREMLEISEAYGLTEQSHNVIAGIRAF